MTSRSTIEGWAVAKTHPSSAAQKELKSDLTFFFDNWRETSAANWVTCLPNRERQEYRTCGPVLLSRDGHLPLNLGDCTRTCYWACPNRHTLSNQSQQPYRCRWIISGKCLEVPLWYCIIPLCWVTFRIHPEIIPVGQFSRRWIKSINQSSVDFHGKPFGWLIDWLIDDKLTLTWLVYWIRTVRSVFTGAGLKWLNMTGKYSVDFF